MRNHCFRLILAVAVSLAVLPSALAQSSAPDLSGVWMLGGGMGGGVGGRRFSMEEPPLQPWALEKYRAAREGITDPDQGGRNELDPSYFCFPPGPSRSMIMPYAFEIVQRPDQVYILFEYDSGIRRIYTDGRGHPEDPNLTWMGHTTGKWEGDTLVVDTVGLREETWLDRVGTPHSDALRIVERFRRLNRNTLEVEFWFEDPKAFTKPWGGKKTYALQTTEVAEFVLCEEHLEMGTVRGKTPDIP